MTQPRFAVLLPHLIDWLWQRAARRAIRLVSIQSNGVTMRFVRGLPDLLIIALSLSCGSLPSRARPSEIGTRNRITQSEIGAAPYANALKVIEVLRPGFLLQRRNNLGRVSPAVYVDGIPFARGVDGLADIHASDISEIQLLSPVEASIRYGSDKTGGVILITTRR